MKGKVVSLNVSEKKGVAKRPVDTVVLKKDWGVVGDVHAGPGDRQVSLLAIESIRRQKTCPKFEERKRGLSPNGDCPRDNLRPGDFAENITTEGIDWTKVKVGDSIRIMRGLSPNGDCPLLQVSKIGKECHDRCEVYKRVGDCIMPREGIFAEVVRGGSINVGDVIEVKN